MKNLIYEIKVENTKLGQKSDEELEGKIIKVKKFWYVIELFVLVPPPNSTLSLISTAS